MENISRAQLHIKIWQIYLGQNHFFQSSTDLQYLCRATALRQTGAILPDPPRWPLPPKCHVRIRWKRPLVPESSDWPGCQRAWWKKGWKEVLCGMMLLTTVLLRQHTCSSHPPLTAPPLPLMWFSSGDIDPGTLSSCSKLLLLRSFPPASAPWCLWHSAAFNPRHSSPPPSSYKSSPSASRHAIPSAPLMVSLCVSFWL